MIQSELNAAARPPALTVVLPIYEEEESLPSLFERLFAVLRPLGKTFEIIAVNDGSTDRSIDVLRTLAAANPELRVIDFRRNYGQTAALMAGFDFARGDVIVTLDADLQNDPADIPNLLAKLDEGYDVVSGWRKNRQDAALRRNLPSRIANGLISRLSGVNLHDYGCTLKAYRREALAGVRLYGEMHRFIPVYASWMGAKVVEIPVGHAARQFGYSKYGLNRIFKVLLDLTVLKFFESYLVKPGDTVAVDQSLITVESDKASMEIPSALAGTISELKVKIGDKIAEGSVIALLQAQASVAPVAAPVRGPAPAVAPTSTAPAAQTVADASASNPSPEFTGDVDHECDLMVLGAGPGGYSAAFR
ncbi:MAG: glycosyltransferase, partial [Alphaproteobacteria bacterium]|nr:glycosyltransferase [Alphaproteobacteria bacterium]